MASGDDSVGGESSQYKRHEDGDCLEDDGESGSHHSGSPVSGDCCSDDDDEMYDYDYDDGGSDYDDISDAEDTKVEAAAPSPYLVLTEEEVLRRQADDTAKVAEVLSIPPAFAAFLLRRYRWIPSSLQDEWFSDERRVRDAAGLPADGAVATALSGAPLACAICFDTFPAGRTRSAACSAHFYCDKCWRGYIRAAVEDGPRCLSLRCPDPSCSAAVVRDLVDAVAGGGGDGERYARFALRSYVEESGGRIKWCPGPGCAHAVEFLGCAGDDGDAAPDVLCRCRHGFCWRCGEEAHRPVSCATVRAWLAKNKSDSETANWVLANTKHCPKCRRAIEKNQGCNHMSCPLPCGHHFCWLCFKPAGTRGHYACDVYRPPPPEGAGGEAETEEEATARQARASLDRYLFHYERWAGNLRSLEKVRQDMDELERPSVLEGMAAAVGLAAVTGLDFLVEAYEQIAAGRRVLRWSHAYGYYLDPAREGKKRELFDYLQGDANAALERLHRLAEVDRKEVFCSEDDGEADAAAVARRFKDYRDTVVNLTVATRTFMGNLVKAFETDLCEVYAVNL